MKNRSFHCISKAISLAGMCFSASAMAKPALDATSVTAWIERHQEAIVEIRLINAVTPRLVEGPDMIAEMIAQSPAQESELSANGVVVDASGLVAVPALPLNPTLMMSEFTLPTPLGEIKLGLESRLSEVRIVTSAGEEFAASVVFSDADTGLMLVKAEAAPERALHALVPDASLPEITPFSQVLCIGKMPASFGYQATATMVRTTGPLEARHGLDPLTDVNAGNLGAAVLDAGGSFAGIVVLPAGGDPTNPVQANIGMYRIPAAVLQRLIKPYLN